MRSRTDHFINACLWYDPNPQGMACGDDWLSSFSENLFRIETAESIPEAFKYLLGAIPTDRFPHVTLTHMRGGYAPVASTFPRSWAVEYLENHFEESDPVLQLAAQQNAWFGWKRARQLASSRGARSKSMRVMETANDHGLSDGFFVPYFGPNGDRATISLAGPRAATDLPPLDFVKVLALCRATMARAAYLREASHPPTEFVPTLTAREAECLQWIGVGKTSQDVATIMGITVHTVEFHLKNAMLKFNASSRVHAFGLAVASGQVSLPILTGRAVLAS